MPPSTQIRNLPFLTNPHTIIAWTFSRPVVIALCMTLLAGCSEEDALRSCKRQVEPAVVVRHLSLPPQKKAELDSCFASSNLKPEFCRAAYLDADILVRDCMSDKGYTFAVVSLHGLRRRHVLQGHMACEIRITTAHANQPHHRLQQVPVLMDIFPW
jgi:hypothetical protein